MATQEEVRAAMGRIIDDRFPKFSKSFDVLPEPGEPFEWRLLLWKGEKKVRLERLDESEILDEDGNPKIIAAIEGLIRMHFR